jgi:hypothetical protein
VSDCDGFKILPYEPFNKKNNMLVINRKPKQITISDEAGKYEFRNTGVSVERGQNAFVLIIETDGGNPGKLYFTTQSAVEEFLKSN